MDADRAPRDLLPTSIADGAYHIVRRIGEGGMATVHEAIQTCLNRRVAVKVMAHELATNREAIARFRREAEVTSAIGHPHIVHVVDIGVMSSGEPFLVMELLQGEDLDRRLERWGRISMKMLLPILKQTASALEAAHAKGVVHRDLKPANIYLVDAACEGDFVKVLDFGVSKIVAGATKLTRAPRIIGTPKYMSPEQAEGLVDAVDGRTDQWALACIVWEALMGDGPFIAENDLSMLYKVVYEDPAPLDDGQVPAEAEAVLRRALSKDKASRYPSISAFALAFERAMVGRDTKTLPRADRTVRGPRPATVRRLTSLQFLPARRERTWRARAERDTIVGLRAGLVPSEPVTSASVRPRPVWRWASALGVTVALSLGAAQLHRRFAGPDLPSADRAPASTSRPAESRPSLEAESLFTPIGAVREDGTLPSAASPSEVARDVAVGSKVGVPENVRHSRPARATVNRATLIRPSSPTGAGQSHRESDSAPARQRRAPTNGMLIKVL